MRKPSPSLRFFVLFSLSSGILLFLVGANPEVSVKTAGGTDYRDLRFVLPAVQYNPVIPDTLWQAFDSSNNFAGLAFQVFPRGYKGEIPVLVGVDSAGALAPALASLARGCVAPLPVDSSLTGPPARRHPSSSAASPGIRC
jgi:hypothetical protein